MLNNFNWVWLWNWSVDNTGLNHRVWLNGDAKMLLSEPFTNLWPVDLEDNPSRYITYLRHWHRAIDVLDNFDWSINMFNHEFFHWIGLEW